MDDENFFFFSSGLDSFCALFRAKEFYTPKSKHRKDHQSMIAKTELVYKTHIIRKLQFCFGPI